MDDRVDLATASRRTSITAEGLRKQIHRGKLRAEKRDGRWYVLLPEQPASEPAPAPTAPPDPGADEIQRHRYQLQARDQLIQRLVAIIERLVSR
jgi:hypothetical protein